MLDFSKKGRVPGEVEMKEVVFVVVAEGVGGDGFVFMAAGLLRVGSGVGADADAHERTHTFVGVDEAARELGHKTFPATAEGHRAAGRWARATFGRDLR